MNFVKIMAGLFLLPMLSFSQIPNPSFENWTNSIPDGWLVNSSPPLLMPVSQSTDAHTGNFALKGEIIDDAGVPFGPYIQPLTSGLGFPVSQNDTMLYGWYKASLTGSNLGLVEVWAYDSLFNQVGAGFALLPAATNYTEFTIPIIYLPGALAKELSIIIQMTDTSAGGLFNVGSYFLIDDLSYSHITTVNVSTPVEKQYSVSPNPANNFISIHSNFSNGKNIVSIYDVTGKKVHNSIINLTQTANSALIDVCELKPGYYLMMVNDGVHALTEKILISR